MNSGVYVLETVFVLYASEDTSHTDFLAVSAVLIHKPLKSVAH